MADTSFKPNTLNIRYKFGEPETCTFQYLDRDAAAKYKAGDLLTVTVNGTTYFGGNLYRQGRRIYPGTYHATPSSTLPNSWALDLPVTAKGYTWLAQRKVNAGQATYINSRIVPTISVASVVTAIGGALGVGVNVLGASGLFPRKFQIDQTSYAANLDRLQDLATQLSGIQFLWFINPNKVLQFYPLTLAPVGKILGPDLPAGVPCLTEYPIEWEESLEQFADSLLLKLDKGLQDPQSIQLTTDGSTTAWALPFAAAGKPQITVNGTEMTVGVDGIDIGFDYYWNVGSFVVRQDDSAAVLQSSDTLSVTFVGHDLRAVQATGTSIASLGPCQAVLSAGDSANSADYQAVVNMELLRRNGPTTTLKCTVAGVPYSLGQQVPAQIPGLVNGYFILRGLRIFDVDAMYLRSELELVAGPMTFSGPQFLQRLAA